MRHGLAISRDLLKDVIKYLEQQAPEGKGRLCNNHDCWFYVNYLLGCVTGGLGDLPAHVCVSFEAEIGLMARDCVRRRVRLARDKFARQLIHDHPEVFSEFESEYL